MPVLWMAESRRDNEWDVAQLAVRFTVNEEGDGSNPSIPANSVSLLRAVETKRNVTRIEKLMSTIDNGPGSAPSNAEIVFQLPGGPVTTGIEIHAGGITGTQPQTNPSWAVNYVANGALNGTGSNPLPPSAAPFVDPTQAGFSGQSPVVAINKSTVFGVTGATVVLANPA